MVEDNNKNNNEKITFFSLLFETIIGIFISGTESSPEHTKFNTKEKWVIWYKNIFNANNFKNVFSKGFKIFFNALIVFILINLFIFVPLVLNQLKSPRYPVARAYLKSSFMVNQLYIIPLSKLFGYGNPLTWGFYPIKEALYNKGISKLPKNEGEREIWWFNVRFVEYKTIVQPTLLDSYTYNDKTYKPLPNWQVKSFERWNDELYFHILSWPNAKISDPKLKKEKLMRFVDLADAYIVSTHILSTKLQISEQKHTTNDFPDHLPYPKPEAVRNFLNIVNVFNNLKSDSAKNDKESYNYFEKNKRYEEDKFLYEDAMYLIGSKSDWGPPIVCSSQEVTILGQSHKNMMDYYNKNKKDLKFGEKGTIEILTSGGIPGFTYKKCTDIPELKEYNEYFIKKHKEFEKEIKGEHR